jgi:hypothetical protein
MARDFEIDYEKLINLYRDAPDQADAALMRMGLHQAERPTNRHGEMADMPAMPPDISGLNSSELSSLMGKLTAWYGYALGRQADAQGRRNASEKQVKGAWAKLRRLKEGTVTDKDDAVRTDSRYVAVDAILETDEDLLIHLRAIVDTLKRNIESISRAMSALDSKINVEGRGAAMARKQGSAVAEGACRTGRRSALDSFRKKRP